MTRPILLASVCLLALVCATAHAQFMTAQVSDNCVAVMASGSSSQPADWLDVHLNIRVSAPSAESAMTMNRDDAQRAVNQLVASGIAAERITSAPPSLSGGGYMSMVQEDAENQWYAASKLTVRLTDLDPETMYEEAGRVVDLASSAAKVSPQGTDIMSQAMLSQETLEFGANDVVALRKKAFQSALENARASAQTVAEAAGRTLGPLVSVSVVDPSLGAMATVMQLFSGPAPAGQATASVMISANYRLQ